jgi:hypothetical protein
VFPYAGGYPKFPSSGAEWIFLNYFEVVNRRKLFCLGGGWIVFWQQQVQTRCSDDL